MSCPFLLCFGCLCGNNDTFIVSYVCFYQSIEPDDKKPGKPMGIPDGGTINIMNFDGFQPNTPNITEHRNNVKTDRIVYD